MNKTLTDEMRVIEFSAAGGPEVIRLASAKRPQPADGQVLIEVVAFGLNRGDCLQRAGIYPPPPGESQIPGLEISGRVVAIGTNVQWPAIGDEVCALVGSGAYAEYCVAESALCLPRPQALSLTEAAGLPEAAFTAFDNIFTRGRLARGERFLVHGGSSGVGSIAIQMARQAGATVIATAGSPAKCDFCRALGAAHAIDYRTQDFADAVMRLTEGRGVDVVLDCVGGPYLPKNIALLAPEGRLVQIYFMQGSVIASFDYLPVMLKRLTLTGSTLRPRTLAQKAAVAEALKQRFWSDMDSGAIRPPVHAVFPWHETAQAHALMETSAHLGKIIVETGK
jgi:NADPH2:quinone reductase